MSNLLKTAAMTVVAGAIVTLAQAQTPGPQVPLNPAQPPAKTKARAATTTPAAPAPARAAAAPAPRRRSVVHHNPYPYPEYYYNDQSAGFRNPGNVGRYAEYYPPGDRFQSEQDPVRVARFDSGGGPSSPGADCVAAGRHPAL